MIGNVEAEATRLLLWLHDRGAFGVECANVSDFVGPESDGGKEAEPLADHLEHLGLATQEGMGGIRLSLTPEGVRQAQRVFRDRSDPAQRVPELRKRMLCWLYSSEQARPANWQGFLASEDSVLLGDRFSNAEVMRETGYLRDRGLISAHRTWQSESGSGWLRPSLTDAGHECVIDYGGDVSGYRRAQSAGQSGTTNNYFPNNAGAVSIGSQNVHQAVTHGVDLSALREFAATLTQVGPVLPQLTEEDQAQIRAAASEIEAEISKSEPDGAKLSRLHDVLWKIVEKAGQSAVTPIVTELGVKAAQVIQHLPGYG